MEIVYSIFIGIIASKIAGMIAGVGLQCRRDMPNWRSSVMCGLLSKTQKLDEGQKTKSPHAPEKNTSRTERQFLRRESVKSCTLDTVL